jgi:hypothetical protein
MEATRHALLSAQYTLTSRTSDTREDRRAYCRRHPPITARCRRHPPVEDTHRSPHAVEDTHRSRPSLSKTLTAHGRRCRRHSPLTAVTVEDTHRSRPSSPPGQKMGVFDGWAFRQHAATEVGVLVRSVSTPRRRWVSWSTPRRRWVSWSAPDGGGCLGPFWSAKPRWVSWSALDGVLRRLLRASKPLRSPPR